MSFLDLNRPVFDVKQLSSGKILVAEPFLADANFSRSVVLITEHSIDGTVGFILNHPTEVTMGDVLPQFAYSTLQINHGGPVQNDTLHMIHRIPGVLGGNRITDGIYWGGSYEALEDTLASEQYGLNEMRLFIGYSGWSPGQLEEEMNQGSWLVADFDTTLLFDTEPQNVWKRAIQLLGKEYAYLANLPINPQLN